MKILGIIPARYDSTRFPGKPLAEIDGKPMIQKVYEQALKSQRLSHLIVATDNTLIRKAVKQFQGNVFLSKKPHTNGTERCAGVCKALNCDHYDFIINIQCDEAFLPASVIDELCDNLSEDTKIATLATSTNNKDQINNSDIVKVAFDNQMKALYFSRSPIPFYRDNPPESLQYYRHIGIYAYRPKTLKVISALPPTPLEKAEKLEQLRWIENGHTIEVILTTHHATGVDRPKDLKQSNL